MSISVALIAWYFPPIGGAGAQRPLHFARGLSSSGASVRVLTPARHHESIWAPEDQDLAADSKEIDVRYLGIDQHGRASDPFGSFEKAVLANLNDDRPDFAVVTVSPFALANLAIPIRKLGIKFVLDLRDPWALDAWPGYRSWWHWRRSFKQMRSRMLQADGIVLNTQDAKKAFLHAIPGLAKKPLRVIENGWCREDFQFSVGEHEREDIGGRSPLRIVHSGTFHTQRQAEKRSFKSWVKARLAYSPQQLDRTGRGPSHLLAAVRDLIDEGYNLECDFFGVQQDAIVKEVEAFGLGERVRIRDYQSHGDSIREIREAGALFLPLGGIPAGGRSLIVPGKTYEYLAAGPPLIAALPAGDARDLVSRSRRSFLADPCDHGSIKNAILQCLEWWKSDMPRRREIEPFMDGFERLAQAAVLKSFLVSIRD